MALTKPPLATVDPGRPITAQGWNSIVNALSALYDAQSCALVVTVQSAGVPVPDAAVVAIPKGIPQADPVGAVPPHGAVTTYLVTGISPGAWTVHVEAPGYHSNDVDVSVASTDAAKPVPVELAPSGVAVPDLFDLPAQDALTALAMAGLNVDHIVDGNGQGADPAGLTESQKQARVLAQQPEAKAVVDPATAGVRLVISAPFAPPAGRGAVRISVGPDGQPWVVDSQGNIFQRTKTGWKQLPGTATDIGVGANGAVWAIGTDTPMTSFGGLGYGYGIYQWTGAWQQVDGTAVAVAVAPDGSPWVATDALGQGLFQRAGAQWSKKGDQGFEVGVGGDGTVWVVGGQPELGGYGVYKLDGTLTKVPGGAVRIAVTRDGRPWIADAFNHVWERFGGLFGGWVFRGSGTDVGAGVDGSVWKIGADAVDGGFRLYQWAGARWLDSDSTVVLPHVLCVAADGGLWHAIRRPDGTYTPFGDVRTAAKTPAAFASVACAGRASTLHVVGVTKDGTMLYAIRNADGSWVNFAAVPSTPPKVVSAGCAWVGDQLHLLAATGDGGLWRAVRKTDGSWSPFEDVRAAGGAAPGTQFLAVAAAALDTDLHVLGVTADGALLHAVARARGPWVPFVNVTATTVSPGKFTSVGCASVGSELHAIASTKDPATPTSCHLIRNTAGQWQPYTNAGWGLRPVSVACANANGDLFHDGTAGTDLWGLIRVHDLWPPAWENLTGLTGNAPAKLVWAAAAAVARPQ